MSTLLAKLKEGLQDAVVFLRTLEQFKIPPVVERRRKELLERLLALQGDTLRDTPPRFEPVDEEEETRQPVRTESKSKVGGLVKGIEEIDAGSKPKETKSQKSVKSEEEPKAPKDDKVEVKVDESKESSSKPNNLGNELKPEQPSASGSCDSLNKLDEKEKKKGLGFRFKRKGKDKEKQQGTSPGRTESPAVDEGQKEGSSKDELSKEEAPKEPPKEEPDEEKEAATQEEDGKVEFLLERRVTKRFGGHQWQKQTVTLKDFTLLVGPKDKVDLVGCTIASTDNGFELYSHPEHKSFMFKEPSDEVKDKCISMLQAAIDECTPASSETPEQPDAKEEVSAQGKQADVPAITVEVEEEPSPVYVNEEVPEPQGKKKRESKAAPVAKVRKLPDQGVQMKGYVYRKMWRGWEKCWCVLTYNAIYFTGVEENAEYSHMLTINPEEGGGSIKEKSGRDRQSKGMMIKSSKKSKAETISVESSEFSQWYRQLEKVIGISGVEELLSEDEEEEEGINEDLYEEVDLPPPPVPASPRPAHHPVVAPSDDFQDMAGEDIYEDFDDLPDAIPESDSPVHDVPALPQRNPPKQAEPPPTLPARNVPPMKVSSPVLPPRNITSPARNIPSPARNIPSPARNIPKAPTPKTSSSPVPPRDNDPVDYEVASPPRAKVGIPARPPPPPTASTPRSPPNAPTTIDDDDDTYDDVVGAMGQGEIEETYDDVVVPTTLAETNSPLSEENYEDMAPGEGEPAEDYVVMEHTQEEGEEGEMYVEVEEDKSPAHAPAQRKSIIEQEKQPSSKAGTFSKFFGGKTKSTAAAGATAAKSHSGYLSCKPPKKSKFTDEWCVLDGNTLQFYRSSTDKKPREKLALADLSLKMGSTEAGAGEFSFQLSKGDKVHHFGAKTKEDMEGWVSVLKVIVKSAAIEPVDRRSTAMEPVNQVFQATEDHIGEGEDQLTFKKGTYIRLITQMSGDLWIGQLGSEAQVFNGKIGKFPTSKVVLAEDLYI